MRRAAHKEEPRRRAGKRAADEYICLRDAEIDEHEGFKSWKKGQNTEVWKLWAYNFIDVCLCLLPEGLAVTCVLSAWVSG